MSEIIYNNQLFDESIYSEIALITLSKITEITNKNNISQFNQFNKLDNILKHIKNENFKFLSDFLIGSCIHSYNTEEYKTIYKIPLEINISNTLLYKYRFSSDPNEDDDIYSIYYINPSMNKCKNIINKSSNPFVIMDNIKHDILVNDLLNFIYANPNVYKNFRNPFYNTSLQVFDSKNHDHLNFFYNVIYNNLSTNPKLKFTGANRYGLNDTISFVKLHNIGTEQFNTVSERNEWCRRNCPTIFNLLQDYVKQNPKCKDIYKALQQCINPSKKFRSDKIIELNDSNNTIVCLFKEINQVLTEKYNNTSYEFNYMTFIDNIKNKKVKSTFAIYNLEDKINEDDEDELIDFNNSQSFIKRFTSIVIYKDKANKQLNIDKYTLKREIENFMKVCNNFIENDIEMNTTEQEVMLQALYIHFNKDFRILKEDMEEVLTKFATFYNKDIKYNKYKTDKNKLLKLLKEKLNFKHTQKRVPKSSKYITEYIFTKKEI